MRFSFYDVVGLMLLLLSTIPKWGNSQSTLKIISFDSVSLETDAYSISQQYHLGLDTSKYWTREILLPAKGRFVQESHYVTNQDTFPDNRLFANTIDENISKHIDRSYQLYKAIDSSLDKAELYEANCEKQWTPAERGQIGQGSVGNIQATELTPWDEMWMMNMMWAPGHRPKRGSKFLMSCNGKRIVVITGYETGPASEKFIGGCTTEVHAYLGTTNTSEILIEYLVDQTLKCGPLLP